MARWRLIAPHYLNVPGEEVTFEETNTDTQRRAKKSYPVPRWLHHEDASCFNYPGEIIVAQGKGAQMKDIIFEGPPTPDMEPLDDEAKAISDQWRDKWINPIENLPEGMSFADALISQFQKQMDKLATGGQSAPVPGVTQEQFAKLQARLAELEAQNAELKKPLRRA